MTVDIVSAGRPLGFREWMMAKGEAVNDVGLRPEYQPRFCVGGSRENVVVAGD